MGTAVRGHRVAWLPLRRRCAALPRPAGPHHARHGYTDRRRALGRAQSDRPDVTRPLTAAT